jgi:uncharacterized protein
VKLLLGSLLGLSSAVTPAPAAVAMAGVARNAPDVAVADGAVPLAIAAIQGVAHVSPVVGAFVETTGIVTAVESNGFYLQDPRGDGDPATSDGLFIYTVSASGVVAGQQVRVIGTVAEFQPGGAGSQNLTVTELIGAEVQVLRASQPLPLPVVIGGAGSLPPTEVIDDDGFALFDPATDGIDFHETLEGMRVVLGDALAVSARNGFGELYAVSDRGAFATRINARSGITLGLWDGNPERLQLQLDDDLLPGFDPAVRTGDRLGHVAGVVGYAFGNYEVKVTAAFRVTGGGLLPETAPPAREHALSIASYNVLNLDPLVEDRDLVGSWQDVDDDVGSGRFDRIAQQIVERLRAPDILALQEVQDDDGAQQTGVTGAGLTWATLIEAIVAAGGPAYEWRDLPPADDADGGQPGGNIRVGFLFDPARVALDETSVTKVLDGDLRDGDAFQHARKPLSATFGFRGREVTVINNHWSSKSGSTPLFGKVQPPVNGSLEQRLAQAQVVHAHVATLLARDPRAHVVVLGDLNEFHFAEPLAVLAGTPPILTDLSEQLDELERYSYVFEGNAQDLDHILVSGTLACLADYDVVHVNAEFGAQLPGGGLAEPASDHDPLLTRIVFPQMCQPDLGFGGPGAAVLSVCGDPLTPAGSATLAVSDLPPGAVGLLVYGLAYEPVAVKGGTLVPSPPLGSVALVDDDLDGSLALLVPGVVANAPLSIFVQFVHADATQPYGFGFSNAVEIRLLGD